jgi:hypothetical protein
MAIGDLSCLACFLETLRRVQPHRFQGVTDCKSGETSLDWNQKDSRGRREHKGRRDPQAHRGPAVRRGPPS